MKDLKKHFQKPRTVEVDEGTLTENYGRFEAQPLEKGFATTLGNAMRRVLLSSIEGAAITSVKIDGVVHEFSTIQGVWEDVLNIILNLKAIPIKMEVDGPITMTLKKVGEGEVKSGDIKVPEGIEIIDKDIHIATLDKDGRLVMEMKVDKNFGYVPAEYNYDDDQFIPIDSVHSPVKQVKYSVENARVGFRTDYEKLILEVWTKGTVRPTDAIDKAAKILREHFAIFMNSEDELGIFGKADEKEALWDKLDVLTSTITDLSLSARATNSLERAGVKHVFQLVQKTEDELMATEKLGKKSVDEIINKINELGFTPGIKLHNDLIKKIETKINTK
jgi:DNA-directed RNA polymerase subunit alpha